MPVTFNSSGLVPAPLVSINKTLVRDQRGILTGQDYSITLYGTIVNVDNSLDSPGASGALNTRMRGTQGGQNYIKGLFSTDYGLLEISSPESSTNKFSIYCQPESVSFDQGNWVFKNTYTVTLRGNYASNDLLRELDTIEESWDTQESEDGSASLSHKVRATGRLINISGSYNNPLLAAKQWVNSRLYNLNTSFDLSEQVVGSGIMYTELGVYEQTRVLADGNFSNRSRVETTDPFNYSFAVTENMLWTQSTYKEEWNAAVNMESDSSRRATININGNITGLATTIYDHTNRLKNASGIFKTFVEPNLYTRAMTYAPQGYTVNPVFNTKQVSYAIVPGNVQYSIGYTALNGGALVSGAIDESIEIQDAGKTDITASIPVPGRTSGPVIQWLNTYTAPSRTVSISATIPTSGNITISNLLTAYLSKPNTNNIITALQPDAGYFYITGDNENWNPIKRTYSRTTSWLIDVGSGNAVAAGIPSGTPHNVYLG